MRGAIVHDITPAQFKRMAERVETDTQPTNLILEDMADGILALDFALTFAGFSYKARHLTLSVVGLLGGSGKPLRAFDAELASHLKCSDRTIRRWRAAHNKEARRLRFSLLEITEGEYYADRQRYQKTSYRFTASAYVEAVVNQARSSELYVRDRRAAIEDAAGEHYSEIPNAPPRQRRRKPRRAPSEKIEQAFINAARNVKKGKQALLELADDSREVFLESGQGAELRDTLSELQTEITEVLEIFPETCEREELKEGVGHFVLPPAGDNRPLPSAAAQDSWERTFAGFTEPAVQSRELRLRQPSPASSDESLHDDFCDIEDSEAEAIRAEACGE
ncbi:MAG: hypothetical protein JOZ02_09830 [Acidobacteria bacterium]|nr:hypothetical protein [Acidobacteriota bacterium]